MTGVSTPAFYQTAGSGGYQPNQGVPAVPVNTPFIYEPPLSATGGTPQIWVGASGAPYGSSTQWGGANVYVERRRRDLFADRHHHAADAAGLSDRGSAARDRLGLDRHARGQPRRKRRDARRHVSGGGAGGRDRLAGRLRTPRLRDGDADRGQRLQPDRARPGAFGHIGSLSFDRARRSRGSIRQSSNTICRSNLAGLTLYFKFQSFNVFGAGAQELSACAVYTYTPTGSTDPIAAQIASGMAPLIPSFSNNGESP